ncbi:uncharacterized protein RHIMIDRAFT_294790 [Rhizopus microsporus ATCC 52813]|uniref:SMP-LTD domain-containing protein n=1 Tax=Rhizopus microsporus ATCC 52813 TaxID=1340429 RepID=A0A2G4SJQ1_RHIZD|nr:uncharacterized protein RHIMIDRAFT_294790 [Rhizopus microsporus ATCC 52813]PHZ08972.1 hypothetical protein RHIMIDRAFT_294790 [Rhizopus microsporus ATCC 52813]
MVSASFLFGYFIGGITFFPIMIIITCAIYFILSKLIIPIYNRLSYKKHYSNNNNNANSNQGPVNDENTSNQLYKVGWLKVHKDDIIDDDDTSSIGDIVASYIRNNNHQNSRLYFSVLKYNTLYLYDSEKQLDCKGVIILSDCKVSIHPPGLQDFELFSKPQHIKLENSNNNQTYYINCRRCIEKEDWYFTFIRASKTTSPSFTIKKDNTHFDQSSMNQLITAIHSDEYHFQTQWFNAILGRIFLSVYRTQDIKDALYKKIVSKLDKINAKRPPFLGEITVRSVDPGHSIPRITHPKLLGISPSGELSAEANLHYDGCIRIEIETVLKWKYSDRLRPFTIDIILAITLEEIQGKVLMKIKEPPTNRIWYAFHEPPKMKWKVEPVVWEKRVGYSVVVKAIETKIQEFIVETMVLPNFDDIIFFPMNGEGGIFEQQEEQVQELPNKEDKTIAKEECVLQNDTKKELPMHRLKLDEDLLTTAKALPELFQQQQQQQQTVKSTPAEQEFYHFALSTSPPEDASICSSLSSNMDDSLQTIDSKSSLGIQQTESKESITSDTSSHVVRLRKSSSLALLNKAKTCASTAVNISPAMAHKDKKDIIDQGSSIAFV